jgi:hypothetical protein
MWADECADVSRAAVDVERNCFHRGGARRVILGEVPAST